MPTIMRNGQFRFLFYSNEGMEPAHVHVRSSDGECKFWLNPVRLAGNKGLSPPDLRAIERLVFEHRDEFTRRYHEVHGQGG